MKENNGPTGVIISVIISFILIAIFPFDVVVLFQDIEIGIALFFGLLFALKFHKPEQSPLKYGIKLGFIAGVSCSILPSIYLWIFHVGGHFLNIFVGMGFLLITGIAFGLIIGGFLGWYYMAKERKKQMEQEREDKYGDDFFQDLIDK
jgi:hypothetical protein